MKKILSILLAVVLVLGLSLVTVTSVVADVNDISVSVDPDTVSTEAGYELVFNITGTLAIGGTISVEFPTGTVVPTSYEFGDAKVQGEDISAGDIAVAGQVVTITLPIGIGAPAQVTVVFGVDAGITNPGAAADYTLRVRTSREPTWVASQEYTIRLSDKSTYEFDYEVPGMIWVDHPVEVDVTLQTRLLGLEGYDHVRIHFWAEGPGNVLFEGWDEDLEVWHSFLNEGYWGPAEGFPVAADYTATTLFRLTFNKVGVYTIVLELLDLDDGNKVLVEDEATVAVTGVSVEVELNKGWNLISLPIVPDDPAIGAVLADVMDDVISVHHYRAATGTWLIYAPPSFTSLTTIEDGKAYWINMAAAVTLTVVGQAIAAPGYGPPPPAYDVVEGWNMTGFRAMEGMTVDEYLKGTDYVRVYGFDLEVGGWFSLSKDDVMTPGLGYWIAFSDAGTIYP